MSNEYIILIDENGQPYIEHGIGDRAHKYLMKIGKGAKARYFYTKQEVDAYYNKLKENTKDKLGFDERDRYVVAKEKHRTTAARLMDAVDKSDKAERNFDIATKRLAKASKEYEQSSKNRSEQKESYPLATWLKEQYLDANPGGTNVDPDYKKIYLKYKNDKKNYERAKAAYAKAYVAMKKSEKTRLKEVDLNADAFTNSSIKESAYLHTPLGFIRNIDKLILGKDRYR